MPLFTAQAWAKSILHTAPWFHSVPDWGPAESLAPAWLDGTNVTIALLQLFDVVRF